MISSVELTKIIICTNCGQPFGACSCRKQKYSFKENIFQEIKQPTYKQTFNMVYETFRALTKLSTPGSKYGPYNNTQLELLSLRTQLMVNLPDYLAQSSDYTELAGEINEGAKTLVTLAKMMSNLPLSAHGFLYIPLGSKSGNPNMFDKFMLENHLR